MSVTSSHAKVRLADHVRACVVGDQLIFLDLLRSKYIGVGGAELHALSAVLLGRSQSDPALSSSSSADLLDEWIRRLCNQQLLSEAPPREVQTTPLLHEPVASLDPDDEPAHRSDWRTLIRLWRSTWIASAWLRRHSLGEIAERVASLRARNSRHCDGQNTEVMRTAVATYMHLRPFALTSHDRCLHDSLALVHFLASQQIFPQWVIGVHVRPFCAHSWVQSGSVVLNDLPERVRAYQPILVV